MIFEYTDCQKMAIKRINKFLKGDYNIFGLFGYAGTGKTALLTTIVDEMYKEKKLKNIVFAAPTNKAVSVLKSMIFEKTKNNKMDFLTVHRLLGMKMKFDEKGDMHFIQHKNSIIGYELIVIDECSMIGKELMAKIITNLWLEKDKEFSKVKIIFMGDPAQLPPVNEQNSITFDCFDDIENDIFMKEILEKLNKKNFNGTIDDIKKLIYPKYSILKTIVRTNKENIMNLSNDTRDWIGGKINKLNLKKYNRDSIKIYKEEKKDEWLEKYIEYQKNTLDLIILTWTNSKKDEYNNKIRKSMFKNKENIDKYEIGDLLIFNDYYSYNATSFHTSELIEIAAKDYVKNYKLENITIDFNKMKVKVDNDTQNYVKNMIDNINKQINKVKLKVYNIYVYKIIDNDEYRQAYEITINDDEQLDKLKAFATIQIQKFKDILTSITINERDYELLTILWEKCHKVFIEPFANVSYGYCITVHKSQGSGFAYTFIDLQDIIKNKNNDECKRCIYTSITRTTKELHILY